MVKIYSNRGQVLRFSFPNNDLSSLKKFMEVLTMNKTELIAAIAEKAGISKKDADKAVAAFIATVGDELKAGNKVQLIGFGSFEIRERAAREGINPLTKEKIKIAASKSPVFKAGKAFKDAVAK